jgi:hypothetical protein
VFSVVFFTFVFLIRKRTKLEPSSLRGIFVDYLENLKAYRIFILFFGCYLKDSSCFQFIACHFVINMQSNYLLGLDFLALEIIKLILLFYFSILGLGFGFGVLFYKNFDLNILSL